MVSVSAPAINRISAAACLPYVTVERMTRPLIEADRWPSRRRRKLLASDLASLLNAIISLQATTEAVFADNVLRAFAYRFSWPGDVAQQPMLGDGSWGELLERMIANTHTQAELPLPLAGPSDEQEMPADDATVVVDLPNMIECSFNPPAILLVWWDDRGGPKRRDFYGPIQKTLKPAQPYGTADLIVRKTFARPELIALAGEILRDASPNENAAPARTAFIRSQDRMNDPGSPTAPDLKGGREESQPLSNRRPGTFRQQTRRPTDGLNRSELDPADPRAA